MAGITELKRLSSGKRREPCIPDSHNNLATLLRDLASYEPENATKYLKEVKGYFGTPARSCPYC